MDKGKRKSNERKLNSSETIKIKKISEEDMVEELNKLKTDLVSDRNRNKELHREKAVELKHVRKLFDTDQKKVLEYLALKVHQEKEAELQRLWDLFLEGKGEDVLKILKLKDGDDTSLRAYSQDSGIYGQNEDILHGKLADLSLMEKEIQMLRESNHLLTRRLEIQGKENISEIPVHEERNDLKRLHKKTSNEGVNKPELLNDDSERQGRQSVTDSAILSSCDENIIDITSPAVRGSAHKNINVKHEKDLRESEKQWQLQKKVSDLTSQTAHLEKRVMALKEENDIMKKKSEEQKSSEEKIKNLKKKNAELASIARRLEDKVKQLQQDLAKKTKDSLSSSISDVREKPSRGKTKDQEKDRTIEELRLKCQQLLCQLRSSQHDELMNGDYYRDHSELECIVRQAMKERLQLERELVEERNNPEIEAQLARSIHLEQRNAELQDEVEKLTKIGEEKERLEVDVMQRMIEVENLEKVALESRKKCEQMEVDLQDVSERNTQLSIANSDMQRQLEEYEEMAKEYVFLQSSLLTAEQERDAAKSKVDTLSSQLTTLEIEIKYLAEVELKRRNLEAEKQEMSESLRLKQFDLDRLTQEKEKDIQMFESSMDDMKSKLDSTKTTNVELQLENEKLREELARLTLLLNSSNDLQDSRNEHINVKQSRIENHSSPNQNTNNYHSPAVLSTDFLSSNCSTGSAKQTDFKQCEDGAREDNSPFENYVDDGLDEDEKVLPVIYRALYDYDPDQHSPNTEPDAELILLAGDYVVVYGDMDEDGFFFGELLDGRRGFVPSNFVQKLTEEELDSFYRMINFDMPNDDPNDYNGTVAHLPMDFYGSDDTDVSNEYASSRMRKQPRQRDLVDTSLEMSINADDRDSKQLGIPDPPVNIQVETGPDHGSVIVSWLPVTITTAGLSNGAVVAGYAVYVDGSRVKLLSSPTGDHVLLESEDLSSVLSPRCITVRTLTTSGLESLDSLPELLSPQISKEIETAALPSDQPQSMLTEHDGEFTNLQDSDSRSDFDSDENCKTLQRSKKTSVLSKSMDKLPGALQFNEVDESLPAEVRLNSAQKTCFTSNGALYNNTDYFKADKPLFTGTIWRRISQDNLKSDHTLNCRDMNEIGRLNDDSKFVTHTVSLENIHVEACNCEATKSVNSSLVAKDDTATMTLASTAEDVFSTSPSHQTIISESLPTNQRHPASRFNSNSNETDMLAVESFQQLNGHRSDAEVGSEYEDNESSYSELVDNNAVTSRRIRDDIPDSDLIDYSDDGGESLVESFEGNGEERVRIFVALFSYDPATMSPNPDAMQDELMFHENQIIKVFGEKDEDGFFYGEANNRRGLVPCNMVSEVHVDDPDVAAQLLTENFYTVSQSLGSSRASSQSSNVVQSRSQSSVRMQGSQNDLHLHGNPSDDQSSNPDEIHYMIALYNYDPHVLSPNTDVDHELAFRKGDLIEIIGAVDEDGFYFGSLNGKHGLVPSNFVTDAPADSKSLTCNNLSNARSSCSSEDFS